MGYKHVLLEIYCGYEHRKCKTDKKPVYCKNGANNPGYHCFENKCSFISYTYCPNELAYAGEFGEVNDTESWIGFGGEMEPECYDSSERINLIALWEKVCKKKIEEAYDEYMLLKKDILKE